MSNFYVKSDFKANVVASLQALKSLLKFKSQFWLLKFKRRLTRLAHLNSVGATRFLLIDDYLRI